MRLAKVVSYLIHPVFVTTFMLAFALFQKNTYLYYTITPTGRWFFLAVAFILTVLAPIFSVGYLLYSKQISSIEMEDRKERIVPMFITVAYTFGLYYMFSSFEMPPVVMAIIGVGVIGTVVTLLITFFWKISAHMISIAGFGGMVLALSEQIHPVPNWVFMVLFLLMGIVGWARLKLNSHTLPQVLAGWVIGYFISYFAMIYLMSS